MPRSGSNKVEIGDVGYVFRKEFISGWFTGEVVEILSPVRELLPFFFSLALSLSLFSVMHEEEKTEKCHDITSTPLLPPIICSTGI